MIDSVVVEVVVSSCVSSAGFAHAPVNEHGVEKFGKSYKRRSGTSDRTDVVGHFIVIAPHPEHTADATFNFTFEDDIGSVVRVFHTPLRSCLGVVLYDYANDSGLNGLALVSASFTGKRIDHIAG